MTTLSLRALVVLLIAGSLVGCDLFSIDDEANPNGPALEDVLNNPSRDNILAVAAGVEASSRVDIDLYLVNVGVIGREYWRTSSADPRFTGDLLGKASSILDANTFYTTRPWNARYRTIRNANILLQLADLNASADGERLTEAEADYVRGFAKTWQAYQYLLNLNLTFENGLRFISPDEDAAGPVLSYGESLGQIAALLNEADGDLDGGDAFFGITDIAFANRALAARVAAYQGNFTEVLSILDSAFDVDGIGGAGLTEGAFHVFSTGSGDITNPFFLAPSSDVSDAILAHPSYAADITETDGRLDKVQLRTNGDGEPATATFDGLSTQFGFFVYKSNVDGIPIARNAELVLLRAEARAQTGDLAGAVADLNTIRNAAGLGNYDGDTSEGAVIDEMLRQRRYELYGEGHRWVDARRYDRLGTLPIDREGDDVWDRFPIPATENVGT
ncbi:MAG: RagB/SusD family nutrient uptake outer membrane protein [Bacteroidota bacterium]